MKIWRNEQGQTLVMMAFCMTALLGFMAMAVDVGLLFRARWNAQIAADAAATAGALDYHYNQSASSAKSAAQAAATSNGITNGTDGAVVTINVPPADGPNSGTSGYVEAIVTQPNPTTFMRILGFNSISVAARGVAGSAAGTGCVWTLGTSGTDINNTGSGSISIPGCDIYDDSSSSSALDQVGSGSITAKGIDIVGNYSNVGSGTISPSPTTGAPSVGDPLSFLQAPSYSTSGCGAAQSFVGSTNNSLSSGCYAGVSNTGSGTLTLGSGNWVINGNLTNTGSGGLDLGAGLYVVTGNLQLTGSGPMSGTGITFYVLGTTSVTGSGSVTLEAPTSGSYDGILIFQSRTDSNAMTVTGSSDMTLEGIIYASDAQLTMTGSGSGTTYTDVVVKSLDFTGSTAFQNYSLINSSSPLSQVVMVE
jgi:Flp pilus assembly protein TadG